MKVLSKLLTGTFSDTGVEAVSVVAGLPLGALRVHAAPDGRAA